MLRLTLVTPEKKIFTDEPVTDVFVPGDKGELNILEGHAPVLTTLTTGIVRFKLVNTQEELAAVVSWGFCEIKDDHINVLAETAEVPQEIDEERARLAIKKAEKYMTGVEPLPEEFTSLDKYANKMERAMVRLSIIKK